MEIILPGRQLLQTISAPLDDQSQPVNEYDKTIRILEVVEGTENYIYEEKGIPQPTFSITPRTNESLFGDNTSKYFFNSAITSLKDRSKIMSLLAAKTFVLGTSFV